MFVLSFFKLIFRGIRRLFRELNELAEKISADPVVLRALEADLGVPPGGLAKTKDKPPSLDGIDQYLNAVDPTAEQMAVAFEYFGRYVAFWKDVFKAALQEDTSRTLDEMVYRLFELTTVNIMKYNEPSTYYFMRMIGAFTQDLRLSIEESFAPEVPANLFTKAYYEGWAENFKKNYLIFRLDQAADLFLKEPDRPLTPAEIIERKQLGFKIFGISDAIYIPTFWIQKLLVKSLLSKASLDLTHFYSWELPPGPGIPLSERIASRGYTLKLTHHGDTLESSSATLTQFLLADEDGRLGWLLSLRGAVTFEEITEDTVRPAKIKITIDTPDGLDAVIHFTGDDKFKFTGAPSASMKLSIEPDQPGTVGPVINVPETTGTRLEIGDFLFSLELNKDGFKIKASARKSALVIVKDQADSFISETIPPKETRIDFALGITATQDGVSFDGGSHLAATIPINKSFLGISINSIQLAMKPVPGPASSELELASVASLRFSLGPLQIMIEQIGFTLNIGTSREAPPEDAISLLPFLYLRDFGFRPPSGLGILVDSAAVTGGGFIFFDPENEQYAGVLQLEIGSISIKALGLLTTRLPDGSKGFSLLIIISVEFDPPIQLVLGFSLAGIGGYLGIHRTMNLDVLRDGLHNHTLDAILFPKDPVANAGQILNTLRSVFPPARGRHLLGVAVIIKWGTPPLLTAEIAVIYEMGNNPRLVILGQLHLVAPRDEMIPRRKKPILELHMDAVGIWDYDRREFSLDARLYDSKIGFVSISGDMALRIRRGNDPFFLFSVGGYHPAFNVPPNFPKLDRLKITFADSKNFRLIVTGYLAVSSNTRQFGGKVDLFLQFGGASIEALIQIDVLWEPSVRFIADFDIKLALKYKGRTLLGAHAVGQFFGPEPKRVKGEASISLLFFDISVSFDHTFGDDRPPDALPQVDPLGDLVAALKDSRNWDTPLPGASRMLVSVSKQPGNPEVRIHPLGELSVRQQVLPLGIRLDHYAGGVPKGQTQFTITSATIATTTIDKDKIIPVNEFFAPAEFIEMSDDEKIARPSFDSMPAGVRLQPGGLTFGGQTTATANQAAISEITFDDKIVGASGNVSTGGPPKSLGGTLVLVAASFSAASRSALREAGPNRFKTPGRTLNVTQPKYVVTGVDNLTASGIDGVGGAKSTAGSFTAVQQALATHLTANPQSKGQLQIVAAFQVEEA